MPVYIREGPTEIPEPSELGGSDGDDDSFLRDPELFQDRLPQPYRMIDNVLNRLLDKAWDLISEREALRAAQRNKKPAPLVAPAGEIQLPKRTNCLSCSEDGKYVFVGHSHGLRVVSTSSLINVAAWEDESVEITTVHSACLAEAMYLLATVDDMGVCRLFAFCPDFIHLIKSINDTDDISQRRVCTKFELSKGGAYAAAVIQCSRASWLEVYGVPVESWLRELEAIHSVPEKQVHLSSGAGEGRFSPLGLVLKTGPPKPLSGSSIKSPFEVLQRTDDGNVIGSGQNHMISIHQWEQREAAFKSVYRKYQCENKCTAKQAGEKSSQCTFHFLLPVGLSCCRSEAETHSGAPSAVCVWWSSSHNLFQYTLSKTVKDKPDAESQPDVVWPNAGYILCSATSRCTCFISLGLADGVVSVWDRCSGFPWAVVVVSDDSIFSRMLFLDQPVVAGDPFCSQKVCVLVTCKSGAHHLITASRYRSSEVTKVTERPTEHGTLPAAVQTVHLLLKLVLFVYRSGDLVLQDLCDGAEVCSLVLPASHFLACPWNPVWALEPAEQTLFIRGDERTYADEPQESGHPASSLFVFRLRESSVSNRFCQPASAAVPMPRGTGYASLEETCNVYLQQRAASLRERNHAMAESWIRLRQLAERHGVHPQPPN